MTEGSYNKAKKDETKDYRKRWGLENQFAEELESQCSHQYPSESKEIYRWLTIERVRANSICA